MEFGKYRPVVLHPWRYKSATEINRVVPIVTTDITKPSGSDVLHKTVDIGNVGFHLLHHPREHARLRIIVVLRLPSGFL